MIKGFKVRLFPNETQTQLLWKHINVSRFVWNYALAEQFNRYKNGEKHLNKYGMRNIFIALKKIMLGLKKYQPIRLVMFALI